MKSAMRVLFVFGALLIAGTNAFAGATFQPVKHIADTAWLISAGTCKIQPMSLEQGATLYGSYQVQGAVDSRVGVELLDEWNFGLWRAKQPYSHFTAMSGTVDGAARLKFTAPRDGRYYAKFCNDKALLLERWVMVDLYTTDSNLTEQDIAVRDNLDQLLSLLHSGFDLPDFDVSVQPCGVVNAFSSPNITMCTELLESFPTDEASALFTFVFLHEFAHTALNLWNLPGADNEDTADEFAAAFLLMGKQQGVVETAATWWLSQTANVRAEALAKIGVDDRHSLSIQRARNLHRWAGDNGDLIQRWAALLAPHFTASVLKSMADDPVFEQNTAIRREYARRSGGTLGAIPVESETASAQSNASLTQRLIELKKALGC